MHQYIHHLTAIEQASLNHSENTVFKVPGENGLGWNDISYKVFWDDITRFAVYWLDKLKPLSNAAISERETIGVWMTGKMYPDIVHLFSLQRAGYALHLVSTFLEDIGLVGNLFEQSGAKLIICDTNDAKGWEQLEDQFKIIPLCKAPPMTTKNIETTITSESLPPLDGDPDDILSIEQSSGTSSGRPKLIPHTRRWVDANAQKLLSEGRRTPVFIRADSFCYAPQLLHSFRCFIYADCTVLTSKVFWENPDDLASIIAECGVTNIALYPSIINDIIHKARDSPNLAEKLRSLRSLGYGGGPLNERTIELAKELRLPIYARVGTTELGLLMESLLGMPHLLQFIVKFDYKFIPLQGGDNSHPEVQELVVLPTSPDCPHPSLWNPDDGVYYTKDLYERVETENGEEAYIFRGRRDDIIFMEEASNCDAKYLEDKIEYLCHDLISKLVVVGTGRPSPALLVEPLNDFKEHAVNGNGNVNGHHDTQEKPSLHSLLALRVESFFSSSKFYAHEVIKPEYIIVLPKGSLPVSERKKRIIRSQAEKKFKKMLDEVYAGDSVWKDERC